MGDAVWSRLARCRCRMLLGAIDGGTDRVQEIKEHQARRANIKAPAPDPSAWAVNGEAEAELLAATEKKVRGWVQEAVQAMTRQAAQEWLCREEPQRRLLGFRSAMLCTTRRGTTRWCWRRCELKLKTECRCEQSGRPRKETEDNRNRMVQMR